MLDHEMHIHFYQWPPKVATIVTCAVCAALMLSLVLNQDRILRWLARRNTYFAPGFTDDSFHVVELGSSQAQIYEMLGSPLSTTQGRYDCAHYSKEGTAALPLVRDLWLSVRVCFNQDGEVVSKSIDVL